MRKVFFALYVLFGFTVAAQAQSSQVSIDAGFLKTANGTAAVPVGGLLQLIASSSGTFAAPTSTSYVNGDNILLGSQPMNYQGGTGETSNTFNITLTTTVTAGEQLLLRFYPSLTSAGMPSAPTLGTTYGQVRSSTIEFGPPADGAETAWVIPSSGKVDLDYITSDNGGTAAYTPASAYASNIVLAGTAGVPEPSVGLLCGLGLVVVIGAARNLHRFRTV